MKSMGNLINNFYGWLSWKLPRRLMYFCIIRAFAYASTLAKNENKHPMDLDFEYVCKAWED